MSDPAVCDHEVAQMLHVDEHRAPSAGSRAGSGTGVLAVTQSGSRSRVTRAYAESPLRLLLPRNHGVAAWMYTSTYGGGLVGGDRIALDVHVGAGASGYLSTQASTKVYRSAQGATCASSFHLERQAFLAVVPDPVVCFQSSRYRQLQRIDLASTADCVLVDWLTSGRRAAGERWAFDEYIAQLDVRVENRLVVRDCQTLRPAEGDIARRMGRFDVLALVVLVGPRMVRHADALMHQIAETPVTKRADLLVAGTMLRNRCGGIVRIAGTCVETVAEKLRRSLSFIPPLLGDDPWIRKW